MAKLSFKQWWHNQTVSLKFAEVALCVIGLGTLFVGIFHEIHSSGDDLAKSDQRAWLGIEEPTYQVDLTKHAITFQAFGRDSGKSPALQADAKICLMVRPKILSESDFKKSLSEPGAKCADNPVGAIPSGNKALFQTVFGNPFFRNDAPIPPHVLYFYGDVSYADIFGQSHSSSYCYRSTDDIDTQLTTCGFKNQMD